ncbi:MADS-box transcription factor 3-like [Vicia villosa]|uniref:MADS-box transcription factor 3-like n=1 Tax=Vicia villosa TaxID=3911 RepID=UPI00273CB2D7|nr:MADS-box transcription factor 3-like [Vicia villosa]
MGRAKITMKFIQNQKTRKLAFIRRHNGLMKKVSEFSRKFEVEACLVVYDGDDGNARPITWPQDSTIVHSMLKKYEQQKIETTPKKFDAIDYFANRKNMVEVEISKLHKKIVRNKYPTWSPSFHTMDGEQLKGFIDIVDAKIQACNHKISMLKNMQQSDRNNLMQNKAQENIASSHSSQLDFRHNIPQMKDISNDPMELVKGNHTNEAINFTNYVSLPLISSTNQINEPAKLDNMMVEPNQEWANELDELLQLDDRVVESKNWASNLSNFKEWDNQLNGDIVNLNSQPDLFAWQDISFMS